MHLVNRSCYSMMESTIRITNLVNYAKKSGHNSVVLCDHNVLFGMPHFLNECKEVGIKGIIALEIDVKFEENVSNFVLIAKDSKSLYELIKVSSLINTRNEAITFDELFEIISSSILLVYGEGGLIESDLINNNEEEIVRKLSLIKEKYDDVYVALSYMDSKFWVIKNEFLKGICKKLNLKTVAVNKNFYLKENDWEFYKALRGIDENKSINDTSLTSIKGRYFLSEEEMLKLYDRDDLDNTLEIEKKCYANYVFEKANLPCPKFVGDNDPKKYLRKLCEVGLNKRIKRNDEKYNKRLNYELEIICEKNFENYFLIVYDIVRHAKKDLGIKVGPGRGSANGSLIAYCLGITDIDPIKYNILFERFLNRERSSMPDIDIDIQRSRRDELIDYLKEYYGEEAVMPAIVFTSYKARSALIAAGNYLGYTKEFVSRLIKRIPNQYRDASLKEIINEVSGFKELVEADERYKNLFRYAYNLEDLVNSFIKHVSAVVVSDRKIEDVIPIIKDDDSIECQISGDYLEDYGILKIDLLSSVVMDNLNSMEMAIKKEHPAFSIDQVSLDDKSVYSMLSKGESSGIFQLESSMQKALLREVKPQNFHELVAVMGLMRPAAKESIHEYVNNKNNINGIKYLSDDLRKVLQDTYGVMVFQDQAMLASVVAANYTIYEADRLRSAFKNNDENYLNNLRDEFIDRCIKNGYEDSGAKALFEKVKNFAAYGFNKSHAVSYATVAYRIAYLKVNYPLYYYVEMLNSCIGDTQKTFETIIEARLNNVNILAPHINLSSDRYEIRNNSLIVPLNAIKEINKELAKLIIEERKLNGNFNSLYNFTGRLLINYPLTESILNNLISSGALDVFGTNRETMHNAVKDALLYAELIQVSNNGVKTVNLKLVSEPVPMNMAVNKKERINNEMEVLGFNVSELSITEVRKKHNINLPLISDIRNIFNEYINGFACVDRIEKKNIKGFDVVNFNIHDESGSIILSLWNDKYEKVADKLQVGSYIKFNGKIKRENIIYGDIVSIINESE